MKRKKQKLQKLSGCFFVLALADFAFSYFLYHYATKDFGISPVRLVVAQKPLVTVLFAILGVLFLFSGIASILVAKVYFSDEE